MKGRKKMTENEEKPESEETDEAKNTTTETTPEDTVIGEALIEEKGKGMRPETKTALGALILVLSSLFCLWICSTADSTTKRSHLNGVFLIGFAISIIVSFIVACFVAWNKDKKDFLLIPMVLLWYIFSLPFAIGIIPLSKYHNQNQLQRDKKIVEALKITVLEDGVEVLLPSEYASENSYLKKLLFVNYSWDMVEEKTWKDVVIPCREGDKYWYKVKLPLPEKKTNTADLFLIFKHVWKDYEITKEISFQDPNSL